MTKYFKNWLDKIDASNLSWILFMGLFLNLSLYKKITRIFQLRIYGVK